MDDGARDDGSVGLADGCCISKHVHEEAQLRCNAKICKGFSLQTIIMYHHVSLCITMHGRMYGSLHAGISTDKSMHQAQASHRQH